MFLSHGDGFFEAQLKVISAAHQGSHKNEAFLCWVFHPDPGKVASDLCS